MMDIGIKRELYSKFEFGDMVARYLLQENGQMILQLVPKNMEDQIAEVVTQVEQDYGSLIPEHAILRFARFLLPKIQADLEKKEE